MGLSIEFRGRNKDKKKDNKPSLLSKITLKVWILIIIIVLLLFYPEVLVQIYFFISTFITNQLMAGV